MNEGMFGGVYRAPTLFSFESDRRRGDDPEDDPEEVVEILGGEPLTLMVFGAPTEQETPAIFEPPTPFLRAPCSQNCPALLDDEYINYNPDYTPCYLPCSGRLP